MAKRQSNVDTVDTFDADDNGGARGFFLNNTKTFGIIGLILLAVVAGVVVFSYSRGKSNDRAQLELARIRPYYDRGEFAVAISGDSSKVINGEKVRGLSAIVGDWK